MNIRIIILISTICLLSHSKLQAQSINIIPHPQEVKMGKDAFTINRQVCIVSSAESNNIAELLQSHIKKIMGYQIEIIKTEKPGTEVIYFKLDKDLAKEAYEFVNKQNVQSVVFGASSKKHIEETVNLINI